MSKLAMHLLSDESGFVVSAEVVLISTIAVLSMVVGLSEVAWGINQELEDTATAFGTFNQSYRYSGMTGHQADSGGSAFQDLTDFCDAAKDITGAQPTSEN